MSLRNKPFPLTVSFEGREDRDLLDRLLAEMPGVVAWSVRALRELRAAKTLAQPAAGVRLLDSFTRLSSPVVEFLEDRCERSPDATVPTGLLFQAWQDWCRSNGHRAGNSSQFGERLRAADLRIERFHQGRDRANRQIHCYRGVTLLRPMTGV